MPAYGSASFGATKPASNVWTAHNIDQADLFITTFAKDADTKTHAATNSILNHYVDAVGHAPPLPDWAAGYWHSKNRYSDEYGALGPAFHRLDCVELDARVYIRAQGAAFSQTPRRLGEGRRGEFHGGRIVVRTTVVVCPKTTAKQPRSLGGVEVRGLELGHGPLHT